MKQKSQSIVFLLLISLLIFNCTVSKRHYRKGYHLAWHNNSRAASKETNISKDFVRHERVNRIEDQFNRALEITRVEITASAEQMKVNANKRKQLKQVRLENDTCGDVLTFRDGTEITVKIVEVFNGTVKYLPCNNLDGPLRVTNGEKIFMIKYANGTKEVFKEPAKVNTMPNAQREPQAKKLNGLALASFISACMGIFFPVFFPIALILGVIALVQMSKYPDKYKGKWMAVLGVILGAIFVLLLVLFLVLYSI
jgi:hypothetical protein